MVSDPPGTYSLAPRDRTAAMKPQINQSSHHQTLKSISTYSW